MERSVLTAGVILMIVGLHGTVAWYRTTHRHTPLTLTKTLTRSTDHPDETPITSTYSVPPNQPLEIQISAIKAEGYIQKVGVDQHQAIGTPGNVNLAGWFTGSPLPGQTGVSIIDGHVQGYYKPGIFKNLNDVRTGEDVGVEFGDHSWRHFTVMSVASYPAAQAETEQYVQLPGVQNQLTLITCGGVFNSKTKLYESRVIVRAKLSA